MSWYPDTDRDWQRSDVQDYLLPGTAIIQTRTLEGWGGTPTWTAVSGGTVACRLDPATKQMLSREIASREELFEHYQLTVPYDAPLWDSSLNASKRRVVINDIPYNVIQIDVDNSWRIVRRAIVSQAQS